MGRSARPIYRASRRAALSARPIGTASYRMGDAPGAVGDSEPSVSKPSARVSEICVIALPLRRWTPTPPSNPTTPPGGTHTLRRRKASHRGTRSRRALPRLASLRPGADAVPRGCHSRLQAWVLPVTMSCRQARRPGWDAPQANMFACGESVGAGHRDRPTTGEPVVGAPARKRPLCGHTPRCTASLRYPPLAPPAPGCMVTQSILRIGHATGGCGVLPLPRLTCHHPLMTVRRRA